MSSFTTVSHSLTFTAYEDSWAESASADVNTRGFPGGDSVAISLAGQREVIRTFTVQLASRAVYDTFASMRGKLGYLQVTDWDSAAVGAVLKQCSPRAVESDGTVFVQAQFVLT